MPAELRAPPVVDTTSKIGSAGADRLGTILVQDLVRSFAEVRAVDGVSFDIPAGEIFGLLGPNGAGKTSTISMLSGMLEPASGTLLVNGFDMARPTREAKRHIGVVPQSLAIYDALSARDNLLFFGRVYGLRGRYLHARINRVLEIARLTDRASARVATYSGGMKRRLNLAVGLLHAPSVVFLDEPTVGVDPQSRNAIFDAIEALRNDGTTIVYTTHYMEEAQRLCDRVAIMDAGRVIALGAPDDLRRQYAGKRYRARISTGSVDAVAAALATVQGIENISRAGSDLDFTATVENPLPLLVGCAAQAKAVVSSFDARESSLEAIFLKLTGRQLRDDE